MPGLDEAINDASKELEKQIKENSSGVKSPKDDKSLKEDKEETPEESPEEDEESEEEGESLKEEGESEGDSKKTEDDLDEDALKEAKTLYKTLKDPNTRQQTLTWLIQAAGWKPQEVTTQADVKEAKKDIKDLVKEKLGPEFAFLAPKLGEVLDAALGELREETNNVQQSIVARDIEKEVVRATRLLSKETNGASVQFERKMQDLVGKIQPGPGMTVEEYVRILYTVASAGSTKKVIQKQQTDKINRNANNAPSRLSAVSGGGEKHIQVDGTKKRNLSQSVEWAAKQLFGE